MAHLSKTVTITDAKNHLLDLVREVESLHDPIAITRNGIPSSVLLSIDDYDALMETIEILADPRILKSLRKSSRQKKKLVDAREVWG